MTKRFTEEQIIVIFGEAKGRSDGPVRDRLKELAARYRPLRLFAAVRIFARGGFGGEPQADLSALLRTGLAGAKA